MLLVRTASAPPPPSGSSASCSRTTPSTGSASEHGRDGFRQMTGGGSRRSAATSAVTASACPSETEKCWRRATSSSTRRRRCRSTPRSTRPSRSTCSADPHRHPARRARRRRRISSPCRRATSPATAAATPPRSSCRRGPFDLGLSWRDEVAAARRLRSDSEAPSRQPDRLAEFRADARTELGAAGAPALAAKTEQLRERWVRDQLVEPAGRAASVGWPDAYAFTKALGEQALIDSRGDVPVSIVRPSIIESAWAEPRPGLDPRLPDGRAGDHLLRPRPAARVPRRARGHRRRDPRRPRRRRDHHRRRPRPRTAAPPICQVASGGINPLKYRVLVDNVSGWFIEHPIYDSTGQPIVVPEWRFPAGRVQAQLTRAKTVISRGERLLHALPLRGKQAELSARLETKRPGGRAGARVRRAVRPVHRVRGDLPGRQPAGDVGRPRRRRPGGVRLRPAQRRLADYIREIHLPSIVSTPGSRRGPARRRPTAPAAAPPGAVADRHLAAFDLENTLIASNVVESYSWLATRRLDRGERLRYVLRTVAEAPACSSSTARPHRLPAPLLPALRGRPGRADRPRTPGAADPR